MLVGTMRIRFDRKTGKEISRELIEEFEISEEVYAEKLVWALMGKSPARAAKEIMDYYDEKRRNEKKGL